jgi:hypothetical protein
VALEPLITAAELRNALGRSTYMALYDEDENGEVSGDVAAVDASAGVTLVRQRAHVLVVSRLPSIWRGAIPDGTDERQSMLLKHAELLYAEALSYDRHPEYVSRFGLDPVRDGKYKAGNETMNMIQELVLTVVPNDAAPEEPPQDTGGVVASGTRESW